MNTSTTGGLRSKGRSRQVMTGPLVSIVTVVYNGSATLERTIRSVLAQTYANVEYIIVDGGSTDGTLDLLRKYEDQLDLWVSERDKGIALCTGEWVGLINADDWYAPDTVQRVVDAVANDDRTNIVHGDIWIHYPNGHSKVKHAKRSGFLLKYWEMVLNHPSFFVRRSYYATHTFDIALRVSGDHHWTLRAWREDPSRFKYLPVPLANFSAGGASMTNPLGRVLREGDRVGRDLGLGIGERWIGRAVRVALYVPGMAKLRFNQFISPLLGKKN